MDRTIRGMERQAAGGDHYAEAKLLLERIRIGEITEDRVRLAAFLNYAPAKIATDDTSEAFSVEHIGKPTKSHHIELPDEDTLGERWLKRLFEIGGEEAGVRLATEISYFTIHHLSTWLRNEWYDNEARSYMFSVNLRGYLGALEAAIRAIEDPSPSNLQQSFDSVTGAHDRTQIINEQIDQEISVFAALAASLQRGFRPDYSYIREHENCDRYIEANLQSSVGRCLARLEALSCGDVYFEYVYSFGFPSIIEQGIERDAVAQAIIEKIAPRLMPWVLNTGDHMPDYLVEIKEIREWLDEEHPLV